jgi:hypothetical protein
MSPTTVRGLASIIVPRWNQLEFTKQCIRARREHTRPPWELIVVDNGSTDDTAVYLAGVQDASGVPVNVVSNATNRGFPAAINQGLQLARGEYLVLLNNDVVVTDAWLEQLVALANARTHLTEIENRNLTIIDFNEEREEASARLTSGCLPAPTSLASGESSVSEAPAPTPPGPPFTRGGKCLPAEDFARCEPEATVTTPIFEDVVSCSAGTTPPGLPSERRGTCLASEHSDAIRADRGPTIGLVGPMSNYAAPPQLVADVPYRDISEMHAFARRWRDEHRGQ